jgi:hypothetical protein
VNQLVATVNDAQKAPEQNASIKANPSNSGMRAETVALTAGKGRTK